MLPDIRSQTRDALAEQFKAWNEPAYRLDQLLNWLYTRRAAGWDEMTNLPRALREKLAGAFSLGLPAVTKVRGRATPRGSSSGASRTAASSKAC